MSSLSEKYITSVISKVAAKCQLQQWRHSLRKFDNIGQNYFGVIIPVVLTGVNGRGDINIPVVLKLAPTDERYRISGAVTQMFRREIFVYTVLLEKYRDFLTSTSKIPHFVIPNVYFVEDEYCKEAIAMQDMSELGYKPFTSDTFLDLDHVVVSLESLAQFHALAFVLKEKFIEHYNIIIETCIPLTEKSNRRYIDIMRDRLMKALCAFNNTPYIPLLEKLKLNCGIVFDKAIDLVKSTCICHGDVWKENILFQYDKCLKPVSACLIDYQTTRLSSPAFDVLYLLISSTNSTLRKENYFNFLDMYYTTFCQILKKHGLDPQSLYTRQDLAHDLKVVAPACLVTANTALWLSNGLQEEGHVRSKHIWTTPEERDKAVAKYKSIVKDIIDDFYRYGYFPGNIVQ